jgi:LPS-assembly lipoprotein
VLRRRRLRRPRRLRLPPARRAVAAPGRAGGADRVLGPGRAARAATGHRAGAAQLHIVSEQIGNNGISVDQYGRSQEYTLRYAVIFDLRSADGADLVPQQAIELSRDYISVPTHSAGTDSERDLLLKELRRDMVSSILRRIDAVSRLQQARGAAVPAQAPAPTPASTPTP